MSALAAAPTGAEETDSGKLFEIPPIQVDKAKPTIISVSVAGRIKLDLSQKSDVDFYNSLQAGKPIVLPTHYFVATTKKTHRRDGDLNVDAVRESKSLVVDLVEFGGAEIGGAKQDED